MAQKMCAHLKQDGSKMCARKLNFSLHEVEKLGDFVEVNYQILSSKCSDVATLKKKSDDWSKITRKVNSNCKYLRTPDEVRKNWDDLQSKAETKANRFIQEVGNTGNVSLKDLPVPDMTDIVSYHRYARRRKVRDTRRHGHS
jgi:hypothetical protein